jgi:hypothetical protein
MPLPYPADESEANSLPDPELNPLVNPVLAEHMGRWAEVYFTSPPEKRDQAVAELIRELKTLSPEEPAPEATNDGIAKNSDGTAEMTGAARTAELLRTCSGCAYKNSPGQNFCSMCGAPLKTLPESQISRVAEPVPTKLTWSAPEPSSGHESAGVEAGDRFPVGERSHDIQEPGWSLPEDELPHFAIEPEPVPYRYRLYVGAALTILLVSLVYMAWRGTKAISGTARPEPVPSKVMPPPPAATAQQPRAMPGDSAAGNAPVSPLATRVQPEAVPRTNRTAKAQPASRIVTKAASSSPVVPEQSGTDDLVTAQKYLNGTQGVTRDRREAALWLWKAVGKGNATATVALSDLYLRGDGVPKSCDQARLLLDAAARKGARAAGERLRNLQAFGCQ